mmetsp:Transcript_12498/g.26339  ORF Transcript_12498/g.26339 Transcript_12498/m.26339 type:complete len:233 (+) Transcript_12498:117-815(+)
MNSWCGCVFMPATITSSFLISIRVLPCDSSQAATNLPRPSAAANLRRVSVTPHVVDESAGPAAAANGRSAAEEEGGASAGSATATAATPPAALAMPHRCISSLWNFTAAACWCFADTTASSRPAAAAADPRCTPAVSAQPCCSPPMVRDVTKLSDAAVIIFWEGAPWQEGARGRGRGVVVVVVPSSKVAERRRNNPRQASLPISSLANSSRGLRASLSRSLLCSPTAHASNS